MDVTREALEDAYPYFFNERTRAAHLATLVHARVTEPTGWPTVPMIRRFARLFDVPMSELGAFFGQMCRIEGNRQIWVDVMRGAPGTKEAKRLMTREQSRAYGFMLMARE